MISNGFCTIKEHKKIFFLLTLLFSPVMYRDRNSEKIDFLKKKLEKLLKS